MSESRGVGRVGRPSSVSALFVLLLPRVRILIHLDITARDDERHSSHKLQIKHNYFIYSKETNYHNTNHEPLTPQEIIECTDPGDQHRRRSRLLFSGSCLLVGLIIICRRRRPNSNESNCVK